MEGILSKVKFEKVKGEKSDKDLTLYTLSTCAFCKQAMRFLEDNDVAYRYVHVDNLDLNLKRMLKGELKRKYKDLPVFPVLIINDERAISGFDKEQWKKALDL
jgi:glutaredoxin